MENRRNKMEAFFVSGFCFTTLGMLGFIISLLTTIISFIYLQDNEEHFVAVVNGAILSSIVTIAFIFCVWRESKHMMCPEDEIEMKPEEIELEPTNNAPVWKEKENLSLDYVRLLLGLPPNEEKEEPFPFDDEADAMGLIAQIQAMSDEGNSQCDITRGSPTSSSRLSPRRNPVGSPDVVTIRSIRREPGPVYRVAERDSSDQSKVDESKVLPLSLFMGSEDEIKKVLRSIFPEDSEENPDKNVESGRWNPSTQRKKQQS